MKRSDLHDKPGTIFKYCWLDGRPKQATFCVEQFHPDAPADLVAGVMISRRAGCNPGSSVKVVWEPTTPIPLNKGELAAKIANRPSLDGLENGLKQLDTAAQKLNAYPPTTSHPDFAKIGKWTGKPVDKKPPPLPTDDKARKALPVFTGPLMYFPHALLQIGAVCKAGNDQHNPGEPMHWAREKSTDQLNTALRHMMDHGLGNTKDTDGQYHLAKAAWRILAELQLTIERDLAGDNR